MSKRCGPDALEYAPLFRLDPSVASLDGRPQTVASLEGDLTILRKNWTILYPGKTFPGLMAVACDNTVPLSKLSPFLETAFRSHYPNIALVMGGDWDEDRPVLGRIHYSRFSSASVQLVDGADGDVVDLAINARMSCEWLVRLAAKTRAAGSTVKLKL